MQETGHRDVGLCDSVAINGVTLFAEATFGRPRILRQHFHRIALVLDVSPPSRLYSVASVFWYATLGEPSST